jgi:hypothetical protein
MGSVVLISASRRACTTTSGAYWANLDSSAVTQTEKLDTDRTICLGEVARAKLGEPDNSDTGRLLLDVSNKVDQLNVENQVMLECVAGKGYKLVTPQS